MKSIPRFRTFDDLILQNRLRAVSTSRKPNFDLFLRCLREDFAENTARLGQSGNLNLAYWYGSKWSRSTFPRRRWNKKVIFDCVPVDRSKFERSTRCFPLERPITPFHVLKASGCLGEYNLGSEVSGRVKEAHAGLLWRFVSKQPSWFRVSYESTKIALG